MQVKCTLCDLIEEISDDSLQAKRLKNRRANLYLCSVCYERISEKTIARHSTGKFRFYEEKKQENDFLR